MAAVSFFWNNNMAAVTSCENAKLNWEASKTELLLNLKRIALEKGFVISENQWDGNCVFFALSEELDHIKGIKISHDDLRRTVGQYLNDNPRLVSVFF